MPVDACAHHTIRSILMSSKDDWPKEKKWKHLYTRSAKLKRAAQLGVSYPRIPEAKLAENEHVNVLFVCSRNQWRSPTAERIFNAHPCVSARSGGTSPNARHRLTVEDIRWADVVMVMENKHRDRVVAEFGRLVEHKQIHVLDIPDDYRYMEPELIEILELSVSPLLFAQAN